MKKVFYAFIMMLGLFVGFRTVNAATESDLRKKLDETFTINGEKYTIPNDIKVSLKRYLDEYEVSDKDATYIMGKVDDAVKIVKESGAKSVNDLAKAPKATKNDLKALAADVSNNTSIKVTVQNGKFTLYTPEGKVFDEFDNLVKQTDLNLDLNMILVGISALVTLAGIALISRKAEN